MIAVFGVSAKLGALVRNRSIKYLNESAPIMRALPAKNVNKTWSPWNWTRSIVGLIVFVHVLLSLTSPVAALQEQWHAAEESSAGHHAEHHDDEPVIFDHQFDSSLEHHYQHHPRCPQPSGPASISDRLHLKNSDKNNDGQFVPVAVLPALPGIQAVLTADFTPYNTDINRPHTQFLFSCRFGRAPPLSA